jgi:hypothetical protein
MSADEDELARLERLRLAAMREELSKRAAVRPPGDDYTHLWKTTGASFSVTKLLVAILAVVVALAALKVASKKMGLDGDRPGAGRVR